MLFPVATGSITGNVFKSILLASLKIVILQNIRDGSQPQDKTALCNSNVKIEETKYDQYSTAEEAEQTGTEGISQQKTRELVRDIACDAQRTEWESL